MSLAFGWPGSLGNLDPLFFALANAGLKQCGISRLGEGAAESDWSLPFFGRDLAVTCRCYQEDEWLAVAIDMDEELFEETGLSLGREHLVWTLVSVGITLLQELKLRYVFLDEEIEATIPPEQYRADYLVGITLVADDVPGLEKAYEQPDILRVEKFNGGALFFRRLDPVPHYLSTSTG